MSVIICVTRGYVLAMIRALCYVLPMHSSFNSHYNVVWRDNSGHEVVHVPCEKSKTPKRRLYF